VPAVAAIGQIGLDVTDHAVRRVYGQATEVIQYSGFAELDGGARFRTGRAVVGFVASAMKFSLAKQP